MPNLKKIDPREGCFWLAQSYFCKRCEEEECEKQGKFQEHISRELLSRFLSNLVCMVAYMEGITYVNLIEISQVVIEIRGAEKGELAVPVNNTLVNHTAFLAADTRPCALIYGEQ